jgi:hypothetical protein
LRNLVFIHPGSGKKPFRIPDPGDEKAPDPEPGFTTLPPKMKEGYGKTGAQKLRTTGTNIEISIPVGPISVRWIRILVYICDGQILPKIAKHWYLPTLFFLITDYL